MASSPEVGLGAILIDKRSESRPVQRGHRACSIGAELICAGQRAVLPLESDHGHRVYRVVVGLDVEGGC